MRINCESRFQTENRDSTYNDFFLGKRLSFLRILHLRNNICKLRHQSSSESKMFRNQSSKILVQLSQEWIVQFLNFEKMLIPEHKFSKKKIDTLI